jgi:hypothetical protein
MRTPLALRKRGRPWQEATANNGVESYRTISREMSRVAPVATVAILVPRVGERSLFGLQAGLGGSHGDTKPFVRCSLLRVHTVCRACIILSASSVLLNGLHLACVEPQR